VEHKERGSMTHFLENKRVHFVSFVPQLLQCKPRALLRPPVRLARLRMVFDPAITYGGLQKEER
jgi:hypothetical protein